MTFKLPRHNVRACFDITSGRLACSINVITFDAEHRRLTEHTELIAFLRKNCIQMEEQTGWNEQRIENSIANAGHTNLY